MLRLLMATGVALACSSATDPTLSPDFSAKIGDPIQLHVGEAVEVAGGWTIGFSAVLSDSRCPSSVTCVWAGDGAVELMVRHGGTVVVDTLHTSLDPKGVTHESVVIQLTDLTPHPEIPGTIPMGEYVVTLSTTVAE